MVHGLNIGSNRQCALVLRSNELMFQKLFERWAVASGALSRGFRSTPIVHLLDSWKEHSGFDIKLPYLRLLDAWSLKGCMTNPTQSFNSWHGIHEPRRRLVGD